MYVSNSTPTIPNSQNTENMIDPQSLLHKFSEKISGKTFVNSRILEELTGAEISHKTRFLKSYVNPILKGSNIQFNDVVVSGHDGRKKILVATRIMHLIIVSAQLKWTDARKKYVAFFLSPHLVPDHEYLFEDLSVKPANPESTNTATVLSGSVDKKRMRTSSRQRLYKKLLKKYKNIQLNKQQKSVIGQNKPPLTVVRGFWNDVMRLSRANNFPVSELIRKFLEEAVSRRKRNGKRSSKQNDLRTVAYSLFAITEEKRSKFMQDLIIASKTEKWTTIYTIIRNFFKIDGLKPYLIPAPRSLQRNGQDYARLFLKLFKPQHTFSGFRIDLVLAVKFAVFCLLNRTNISGVSVDIWGDGAEIGKKRSPIWRSAFWTWRQEYRHNQ